MRDDYKHLISDTSRNSNYGWRHFRNTKEAKEMPDKMGYRKPHIMHWEDKDFTLRTKPIKRMLEKNVGKSWDRVWSAICRHADARSHQGYELREYIKWFVTFKHKEDCHYWWPRKYYVDDSGILRKNDREYHREKTHNPNHKRDKRMHARREKERKKIESQNADWYLWQDKQNRNKKRKAA